MGLFFRKTAYLVQEKFNKDFFSWCNSVNPERWGFLVKVSKTYIAALFEKTKTLRLKD